MQRTGRGKQSIWPALLRPLAVVSVYLSNSKKIVSYDFCAGDQARRVVYGGDSSVSLVYTTVNLSCIAKRWTFFKVWRLDPRLSRRSTNREAAMVMSAREGLLDYLWLGSEV